MKQLNQLVCGNPNIFRSIQRSSEKAVNRLMACSVVQKCLMFVLALWVSAGELMAASKGAAGFTKATSDENPREYIHSRNAAVWSDHL